MKLGVIVKQPADRQNYFIEYGDYLQESEVVLSSVITVVNQDVLAEGVVDTMHVVQPVVVPGGTAIEFWLDSGLAGSTYKLEATTTTTSGNIKQDEIKIKVKEV